MAKRGRKTKTQQYDEIILKATERMLYKQEGYNEFKDNFSKEIGVTPRQAENIWAEVKKRLKERYQDNFDQILEAQISRYMDLLERCKDSGNRRTEREVLDSITKLYGLETKKIDVTSGGNPINVTISLVE